jgi:AraC-like DNA-binding protein
MASSENPIAANPDAALLAIEDWKQAWGEVHKLEEDAPGLDDAATKAVRFERKIVRTPALTVEDYQSLAPDVEVRLVELAASHGMSVRSLCRHFRKTFGTTVLAYVSEKRMENARVTLEQKGFTIDQAAYIAGFAHTSNFSSAFQRRYGYRPSKLPASWGRGKGRRG